MDPLKLATLKLIVSCTAGISVRDRGYQLIEVAGDYVDDGLVDQARDVLMKIEESYFTDYLPKHLESKHFSKIIAKLIDVFGLSLTNLQPRGTA